MVVPPVFRWPLGLLYWVVHALVFLPELRLARAGALRAGREDAGTLRTIVVTVQLAYLVALALAFQSLGRVAEPRLALAVGLALMLAGAWLRRLCFLALGESFTGDVRVRERQAVVATGPYRRVRHPSYTAAILLLVGSGVALGNFLSAATMGVAAAAAYAHRARVEERVLAERLGAPYCDYQRRTWRFLPFLY